MRFFILIICTVFMFCYVTPVNGQAEIGVSANNAVLMEQSSGRVLFEKQAHERQSIASITKIMTAIIAIESGQMDEVATASRRAIYTEGSSIYLEQGEKMSIKDLVYGLMLRSGNDSAVVISEHIGGSVEGFVYMMNEKARWLGMTNTNFMNPHGLDGEEHYSTAYDMALLMRYAMDNDLFREVSETTSYKSDKRSYYWQNKNKLLTMYYDSCTGGKTGFTRKSGRTLASSAHKNNMDLIAVTLNAPDDWKDHIGLYEWGFDKFNMQTIMEEGEKQYTIKETGETLTGYIPHDVLFPLTTSEHSNLTRKTYRLSKNNAFIGKTVYYINSASVTEVPLFSFEVTRNNKSFVYNLISIFKKITGMN